MKTPATLILAALLLSLTAGVAPCQPRERLLLVYEDKPNSNRCLGSGTAIPWEKPGLTVDLLLMTARKLNIDLSLQRMPWKRCTYMVQHGLADGLFHASFTPQRAQYALFPMKDGRPDPSRAAFIQSYHFYTTRTSHVSWDGMELRNLGASPVGITMGYSVAEDLDRLGLRHVEFIDQETCLVSLVEGRVNAVAGLEPMMDPIINAGGRRFQNVSKLQPALKTKPYFVVFSRKLARLSPGLPDRFWATMKEVEDSKEFGQRRALYQ